MKNKTLTLSILLALVLNIIMLHGGAFMFPMSAGGPDSTLGDPIILQDGFELPDELTKGKVISLLAVNHSVTEGTGVAKTIVAKTTVWAVKQFVSEDSMEHINVLFRCPTDPGATCHETTLTSPSLGVIQVHPRDYKELYVTDHAGVWHTEDWGESWNLEMFYMSCSTLVETGVGSTAWYEGAPYHATDMGVFCPVYRAPICKWDLCGDGLRGKVRELQVLPVGLDSSSEHQALFASGAGSNFYELHSDNMWREWQVGAGEMNTLAFTDVTRADALVVAKAGYETYVVVVKDGIATKIRPEDLPTLNKGGGLEPRGSVVYHYRTTGRFAKNKAVVAVYTDRGIYVADADSPWIWNSVGEDMPLYDLQLVMKDGVPGVLAGTEYDGVRFYSITR